MTLESARTFFFFFLTGRCPGTVLVKKLFQILVMTLWPLILAGFLPKIAETRQKNNCVFPGMARRDRALALRYLNSPMAKFFLIKHKFFLIKYKFFFQFRPSSGRNRGLMQILVISSFRLSKALKTQFFYY